MSTVTLHYNRRNRVARKTLEYISSLGVFKIYPLMSPMAESDEDIRFGRVYSAENADDLISQCLK